MINALRRRKDRQRGETNGKQGQKHLKREAKVPKSGTEDEEVRDGRGMGGHRACEPGVFRGMGEDKAQSGV